MRVRVKLYASLSRTRPGTVGGAPFEVELSDGATVGGLLATLQLPSRDVKVVFVGGRAREPEWPLDAGDEVGIFPLVGGG